MRSNHTLSSSGILRKLTAVGPLLLLLAVWAGLPPCTRAHVALTYPPARNYDLDFLDNSRTQGPCGMPKGNSSTLLVQGSTVDVTWHLAYPHQGGYRLELLDPEQRILADLTDVDKETPIVYGDATAQSHRITLPKDTLCSGCTLRLLRQAAEWGPKYQFWSCADVDIVERRQLREKCSGNGRYMVNTCRCQTGFYGSACQYSNECETDADCGVYGKCINVDATSYPKKQCYCQQGRFGSKCSKSSLLRLENQVNFDIFTMMKLSDKMKLYYRIIPNANEIEIALVAKGTSYVAIGWRPSSATEKCREFPFIAGEIGGPSWKQHDEELANTILAKKKKETVPEGKAVPEGKPEPKPEPEPEGEPEPVANGQAESKPKKTDHVKPHAEGKPEPEPEPESEPEPTNLDGKPKNSTMANGGQSSAKEGKIDGKSEPSSKPEPAVKPEPSFPAEPKAEPEPDAHSESSTRRPNDEDSTVKPASLADRLSGLLVPSGGKRDSERSRSRRFAVPLLSPPATEKLAVEDATEAVTEAEPEPVAETEAKPAKISGKSPWVPRGSGLHAMDCTDIVVGTAYGNSYRVMDYYTRDRSTPRTDDFWGGEDSITAALGWERDGETTIVFRKPLTATHASDYAIENDLMHVIWAIGQEPGAYVHSPASGLEKGNASVPDFYKKDELKYHGKSGQRGTLNINFRGNSSGGAPGVAGVAGGSSGNMGGVNWCGGQWGYPAGCSLADKGCQYHVRWEYFEKTDDIRFTIITTVQDKWTGIGFSDNTKMSQSDVILGYLDDRGKPNIIDGWLLGYQGPSMDRQQSFTEESMKIDDGVTTMDFRRKRNTNDDSDLPFTDDSCLYFEYPIKGGRVTFASRRLFKHDATPIFSTERICIRSCAKFGDAHGNPVVFTTTPKPPQLLYEAELMLTGLGNNFNVPKPGSEAYNKLAERIKNSIEGSLNKLPGYEAMEISSLSTSEGGLKAKLEVVIDKDKHVLQNALKPLVNDTVNGNAKESKVYEALHNSVAQGRIGVLTVNPSFLRVNQLLVDHQSPRSMEASPAASSSDDIRTAGISSGSGGTTAMEFLEKNKTWFIVGVVIVLLLLALIQVIVTINRIKKKKQPASNSKATNYASIPYEDVLQTTGF